MAKIKKLTVKILLDIVMCLALVLLYKAKVLTLTYHEVMGCAILLVFLVHVLLNRKWVASVGKKLFSPSTPARTKFSYWMTVALVVCFLAIIITGVFFSKIVFKGLFGPDYEPAKIWRTLHLWFSAVSLVLVGVHVGLYWDMVRGFFKKYVTLPATTAKVVSYVALAAVVVWGGISIPQTGMTKWLTGQSTHNHGSATQAEDGSSGHAAAEGEATGEYSGHGDAEGEGGSERTGDDGAATQERSGYEAAGGETAGKQVAEGEYSGHGSGEQAAEGEYSGHGESAEGGSEARGEQASDSAKSSSHGVNVTLSGTLLVISQYSCIIGLFATITYWIDRLLKRNKRTKKAETAQGKE